MTQFFARIQTYVKIAGCPKSGLEALDWRRLNGFSDRMDNHIPIDISGMINEGDFRRLAQAGWNVSTDSEGNGHIDDFIPDHWNEFHPCGHYGWRATVNADPGMPEVDLACLAALEARRKKAGVPEMQRQLADLETQVSELKAKIAALS